MKYTQANLGRIFILKLEQGEKIPEAIEEFAKEQKIQSALVQILGGADGRSKVVAGPDQVNGKNFTPIVTQLPGISEAVGVGTLFVNEEGVPKLHLHAAFGRNMETITGCTREGIVVWHTFEVIIIELADSKAHRVVDPSTGLALLDFFD